MKKIITLLLCLSCLVSDAQYTAPIQNPDILSNQSFKKIAPYNTGMGHRANAVSVFFKGGITEENVSLEWYLYKVDTITHTDSLGVVTYTYAFQQYATGTVTLVGDDLNTFWADKNSRFYLLNLGLTIRSD